MRRSLQLHLTQHTPSFRYSGASSLIEHGRSDKPEMQGHRSPLIQPQTLCSSFDICTTTVQDDQKGKCSLHGPLCCPRVEARAHRTPHSCLPLSQAARTSCHSMPSLSSTSLPAWRTPNSQQAYLYARNLEEKLASHPHSREAKSLHRSRCSSSTRIRHGWAST